MTRGAVLEYRHHMCGQHSGERLGYDVEVTDLHRSVLRSSDNSTEYRVELHHSHWHAMALDLVPTRVEYYMKLIYTHRAGGRGTQVV